MSIFRISKQGQFMKKIYKSQRQTYMCVCVCVYICIYTYIYINIYTYKIHL